MTRILKAVLTGVVVFATTPPAVAQTYRDSSGTVVPGVVPIEPGVGPLFTPNNPGVISGSFSATLSGFQPTPSYSQLSAGTTSSRVVLPVGAVVVVYNTGSNVAYVTIGNSSVTASPTGSDVIQPNSWMAFTIGSATFLAGITTSGSTGLNISGGAGLPTGAGGGGGGGGSIPTGSAGSPNSSVVTVQGISGGTAQPANVSQFGGSNVVTGTGASGAGVPRVTVANDSQVITTPKAGSFSVPGCTVGTSQVQCLAAGSYNHVQIQNASASASIACSWGGTAVLNSSGSVQLAAGQSALWGPNTAGAPTVALNCIASAASTPLYLESN